MVNRATNRPLQGSKYEPLFDHLAYLPPHMKRTLLTFDEIEAILQARLPLTALKREQWWANDATHAQAQAWMLAGWETSDAANNLRKRRMVFVR